jgi:hypothetical protein
MELKIKINQKQRLAYIPKALFQVLGTNVRASPNRATVLLYSEKTGIDDAIRSLDIIGLFTSSQKTREELLPIDEKRKKQKFD